MNKELSDHQLLKYNRQIVLPQLDIDGQEKLLNSKILIIGIGGLGSAASQYIVASGIGEVTLVDDDRVETSNLHRQVVHSETTVGMFKVESAFKSLSQINGDCKINTVNERLTDERMIDAIKSHHLIFDCSDNLTTREQINRLCWKSNRPFVSAAAIRFEGNLISFDPAQNGPCYQCMSRLFSDQTLSCTETGIFSPVVGIMGLSQALLGLKLLLELGNTRVGELQLFDALAMEWRYLKVSKSSQCSVCS